MHRHSYITVVTVFIGRECLGRKWQHQTTIKNAVQSHPSLPVACNMSTHFICEPFRSLCTPVSVYKNVGNATEETSLEAAA